MSKDDPRPARSAGARFVRNLYVEIDAWIREGLIAPELGGRIKARYPEPSPVDWRGRLVTALSVMAATMLGAGVILFFASNWDAIPRFAKFLLSTSVMLASYYAGYTLSREKGYPRVGGALIFLGCILYGSAIYLVAQAFHLEEHFPNGFLLWAAGILPMILVVRSPYILCLFTLILCAWSGTETFAFNNYGVFPFLVVLVVVFPLAYKYQSRLAMIFAVAAFAYLMVEGPVFEIIQVREEGPVSLYLTLAAVFGGLLWIAGDVNKSFTDGGRYNYIHQFPGIVLMLGVLYAFSFPAFFREFRVGPHGMISEYHITAASILLLLAAQVLALVGNKILRMDRVAVWSTAGAAALCVALCLFTFVVLPAHGPKIDGKAVAIVLAGAVNLAIFLLIVGMVVQGHRAGNALLINAGLLMFALVLVTRYVDIFWGMMSTSLFFIVGGILVLAGGIFLEKQRRRLVGSAGEGLS